MLRAGIRAIEIQGRVLLKPGLDGAVHDRPATFSWIRGASRFLDAGRAQTRVYPELWIPWDRRRGTDLAFKLSSIIRYAACVALTHSTWMPMQKIRQLTSDIWQKFVLISDEANAVLLTT